MAGRPGLGNLDNEARTGKFPRNRLPWSTTSRCGSSRNFEKSRRPSYVATGRILGARARLCAARSNRTKVGENQARSGRNGPKMRRPRLAVFWLGVREIPRIPADPRVRPVGACPGEGEIKGRTSGMYESLRKRGAQGERFQNQATRIGDRQARALAESRATHPAARFGRRAHSWCDVEIRGGLSEAYEIGEKVGATGQIAKSHAARTDVGCRLWHSRNLEKRSRSPGSTAWRIRG